MATTKNVNRSRSSKQETGFEKLMGAKIFILDKDQNGIEGILTGVYPHFLKLAECTGDNYEEKKTRLIAISYILSVAKC